MVRNQFSFLALLFVASLTLNLHAESPDDIVKRGKLIFSDDFNRSVEGDVVEELGNDWATSTADGNRADLQNNTLVIMKGQQANHSLSVRHDNPFDDGVIKQSVIKTPIGLEKWHELTIVNIGPKFEVYIDGASVGAFSSEGLDHHVKQNIALGVSGKVAVDDLQIWSLN